MASDTTTIAIMTADMMMSSTYGLMWHESNQRIAPGAMTLPSVKYANMNLTALAMIAFLSS